MPFSHFLSDDPSRRPSEGVNLESGLFDFQINGFGGVDFQTDDLTIDNMRRAVAALRRHGVARIFATLITDSIDRLCHRFDQLEQIRGRDPVIAHCIAGYHLEGPWLCPEPGYCGAHLREEMHAPTLAEFERLNAAARGQIRLVTLAPEWSGSPEFIAVLRAAGVQVALGHTNASEVEIDSAIAAGARFCTHLGNGVPAMLPRHDNVIHRLLARDELTACFIPDGIHLPPFVLRNLVRAKPSDRVLFTTDAMAGAGAPPGIHTLGTLQLTIGADGVAWMPNGNGFAGSTLSPDQGVLRVASYLDLPLTEARRLWSDAPAAAFGVMLSPPSSL
jgi:N-acetylglucosamine-6-phosphate deacetylase